MQELDISVSAKFITLTYDTATVPITEKGFMTLKKEDLQQFFKRLRYYEKENKQISLDQYNYICRGGKPDNDYQIKYYACGEYGTKRKRPHYHIILFNVRDEQSIYKAWTAGSIHIDQVNNNTIDYTLKYILKNTGGHKFKAFDGIKEFSVMSKKLGDNYITRFVESYYRKNLDVNYLVAPKGYKVPMPKYYRDKILNKQQKEKQIGIIKRALETLTIKKEEKIRKYGHDPEKVRILAVQARSVKLRRGENRSID